MANAANPIVGSILGFLAMSGRRGSVLLAIGIFGGVAFPPLALLFHDVITPLVLGMMTLIFLRVDLPAALAHLRRPAAVAAITASLLLLSPVLMWLLVAKLPIDPGIEAGLVIFACGCAATSAPAFARMVRLDPELSLVVSLASTVLVPLTAPPIAVWLLGADLTIGVGPFMLRLLLVVGLPALLSLALRRVAGAARLDDWGDAVDGLLVWLIVLYGFGVMEGLTDRIAADPAWVAQALAAAFLADYGLNAAATLLFWPLGARLAASAGLMAGNRNMALFLAVLPPSTDARITLFFALCQFPLFLSPFLLRPAYRRFWA